MKYPTSYPRAFTLIEVLLAMVITSIIILAIYGVYGQGSKIWNRSEADAEAYHQIINLTDMFRSETGSIYLQKPPKKEQENPDDSSENPEKDHNFVLSDSSKISYYTLNTSYSKSHRYGKISRISYSVETSKETGLKILKRQELLAAGGKVIEVLPAGKDITETLTFDTFSELRFEVYVEDPETKEFSWKKDYKSNDSLPKAVSIYINKPRTKFTDSYKTRVIFPVQAGM